MKPHFLRSLLIVLACSALYHAAPVRGEAASEGDRWYVIRLAGQRAGWMHTATQTEDDRIITHSRTHIVIRRGGIELAIELGSRFTETTEGRPIEAESVQRLAGTDVRQVMIFKEDAIELMTIQGGQRNSSVVPLPEGGFLAQAAAEREMRRQFNEGAEEVTVRTIDPALGAQVIDVTTKRGERTNVEVFGKVVPATVMLTRVSMMPNLTTREYVDDEGRMVRSTVAMLPGMEMEILAADEALAKAELDPPELMAQTLIEPDRPLRGPRELRKARYRVSFDAAAGRVELPSVGYQSVARAGAGSVLVTVDLDDRANPRDAGPTDDHRRASIMVNSDDPEIRRLTDEALVNAANADDGQKARLLRKFVRGYVDAKDLSVGFATASEVARTRQGDCTEHAVLLAAMLRAAGIPSRTVSGLVYVPSFLESSDVFGYHMWTQAWVRDPASRQGGRWIDLDAAIGERDFDAAHIALSHSAMNDQNMTNDLIALYPLIGRLSIRVLEPAR